jgi:preprotein translocase subunit SecA
MPTPDLPDSGSVDELLQDLTGSSTAAGTSAHDTESQQQSEVSGSNDDESKILGAFITLDELISEDDRSVYKALSDLYERKDLQQSSKEELEQYLTNLDRKYNDPNDQNHITIRNSIGIVWNKLDPDGQASREESRATKLSQLESLLEKSLAAWGKES